MKAPKFWVENNFISKFLYPFSIIYYYLYKFRCFINFKPYKSEIRTLCIGNLVVGGAGKTPVAISVSKFLNRNSKTFCFLSKGYGVDFDNVIKLYPNHTSDMVGDEAILLSKYGDVFISKDRVSALKYINSNFNYDYIILDDGLQNPTFKKDKVILVIDGYYGLGNRCILPAGPLRDKYFNADLTIITNEDKHNLSSDFNNVVISTINTNANSFNKNIEYVAFCGIGRPDKFKKTLEDNKIKFNKFISFSDHYKYRKRDIKKLKSYGYRLITTEKDWVKIEDNDIDFVKIDICIDENKLAEVLL